MADLRQHSSRIALGVAALALALLDILGLVQTLRTQTRTRERAVRRTQTSLLAARPRLASAFAPGGVESWSRAAAEVISASLADEFEVFDLAGHRRFARPTVVSVPHSLTPEDLRAVRSGSLLVVGPIARRSPRLLAYDSFRSGDETVVARYAIALPELVEDLKDRKQLLFGYAGVLIVLLLVGAVLLLPSAERPAFPHALDAYQEAMRRLQQHGQALSREHATERQRLEQALHDSEAMARAGELTAGIAHEVRNGLATILGYARLVEQTSPGEAADAARRIREECEGLEGVVRRFMEFVKTDSIRLEDVNLRRLLERVAAHESRTHAGASVVFSEVAGPMVKGDADLLERAFENLLRNAREAAGEQGHVEIGFAQDPERATVTIVDDGPGLPPENPVEPRPFFTTKAGGLGLGLPLALKIVRLHGGDLRLASVVPHGAAATVCLPVGGPENGRDCYDR